MRYETPKFAVVGNASQLVLGGVPFRTSDSPLHKSSPPDHVLGLDE